MKRTLMLTGIALAALTVLPLQAVATPITATIDLDTVFTGSTPDGSAPWLTAEFTSSTGSSTGTLVLSSTTGGSDFLQGLDSKKSPPADNVGWAFYLNQALSSLTCTAGKCADNNALFAAGGLNTGPVPGTFNLGFGWSSGNRFMGGDSATYALTFSSALSGNPFVQNGSSWSSVAHVQGITGGCSGWIVSGDGTVGQGSGPCTPPVVVPEPDELGLFGLGLLLAGLLLGLRRRFN